LSHFAFAVGRTAVDRRTAARLAATFAACCRWCICVGDYAAMSATGNEWYCQPCGHQHRPSESCASTSSSADAALLHAYAVDANGKPLHRCAPGCDVCAACDVALHSIVDVGADGASTVGRARKPLPLVSLLSVAQRRQLAQRVQSVWEARRSKGVAHSPAVSPAASTATVPPIVSRSPQPQTTGPLPAANAVIDALNELLAVVQARKRKASEFNQLVAKLRLTIADAQHHAQAREHRLLNRVAAAEAKLAAAATIVDTRQLRHMDQSKANDFRVYMVIAAYHASSGGTSGFAKAIPFVLRAHGVPIEDAVAGSPSAFSFAE